MTIEELRKSGMIAYEYIRGSHAYGLATETSDIDIGGVFICPQNMLYGLRSEYPEQVSDERGDTVFYEFGRWVELLLKSNPTALESLYIPERCVIGKIHPMVQYIIDNKEMFLSKDCFKSFTGYAVSQIHKARGLNKKIVNPITRRKGILDFVYTFHNQGSKNIQPWLEERGLKQRYCGLVNIPNMHDVYGVYYDFGNHCANEKDWVHDNKYIRYATTLVNTDYTLDNIDTAEPIDFGITIEWLLRQKPIGYRGIIKEETDEEDNDDANTKESTQVRLSSISDKNNKPICWISYNESGFTKHCIDYKDYKEWESIRSVERYESNLIKNYDGKKMSHCMRLTRMGKEIAQGKGINVDRTNIDRDYLLAIKQHKFEYDEIITQVDIEKQEMEQAIEKSTLKEHVDKEAINNLLITARINFYNTTDNFILSVFPDK